MGQCDPAPWIGAAQMARKNPLVKIQVRMIRFRVVYWVETKQTELDFLNIF
jgi:hypothetical protein